MGNQTVSVVARGGQILEVMCFDRPLPKEEHDRVVRHLTEKYGIDHTRSSPSINTQWSTLHGEDPVPPEPFDFDKVAVGPRMDMA